LDLTQNRDSVRDLVLAVFNLLFLLPDRCLISKMDFTEINFEDGRWMKLAQASVLAVLNLRFLLPEST
jgi:hypothetical protein